MATRTGYYIVEDIAKTGIYHIYEVTKINNSNGTILYEYMAYPICEDSNSIIPKNKRVVLSEENDIIEKIINILNNKKNNIKLCENCIRKIIGDKQDILFKK
ncbi:hypothetical protein [Brachyspira pulli]|uniref:hypothetical protein n=1 Tax=Brachyspira pulli TaxID=310721 RepID=UPI0030063742